MSSYQVNAVIGIDDMVLTQKKLPSYHVHCQHHMLACIAPHQEMYDEIAK